jgi:membrane-anchored mycosin MYCP
VLVVAAAGNGHDEGNQPDYPAAVLQPLGSRGRAGIGLAVGATTIDGSRAPFSNTGSYLSLAAPGYNVFAAESADADWPRAQLPWASPGSYGWASGTSFAAPEVAGAAALVWAANPRLTAPQVAKVLKQSAIGSVWTPGLGWGRLDAAAAVELALKTGGAALRRSVQALRTTMELAGREACAESSPARSRSSRKPSMLVGSQSCEVARPTANSGWRSTTSADGDNSR